MTDTAIEPCPWCGDADPAIDNVALAADAQGQQALVHALLCNGCGAIGPHDPNIPQTAEEAVAKWNARTAR